MRARTIVLLHLERRECQVSSSKSSSRGRTLLLLIRRHVQLHDDWHVQRYRPHNLLDRRDQHDLLGLHLKNSTTQPFERCCTVCDRDCCSGLRSLRHCRNCFGARRRNVAHPNRVVHKQHHRARSGQRQVQRRKLINYAK